MARYYLLLLFPLFSGALSAQSDTEVAACLRACLQVPELEAAFTQEWGALRPLYLRKRENPSIGSRPTDKQFDLLTAADFRSLPWEVIPVTREDIQNLPLEEAEFGILEAGIEFRGERATAGLFINLPRYPRQWMSCSFLLQKEGGQWLILEKSIEVLP